MQLTRNFNLSEFQSKDGSKMPQEVLFNIQKVANQLQVLRDYLCFPIHVLSGYRSIEHNKAVGGVKNSYHTFGMACDIQVKEMNSIEVYKAIEFLIEEGSILQGGVGVYPTFVHYDFRGSKARWQKDITVK